MKVIVLDKSGSYSIIDEDDIGEWLKDGSLSEGDIVIIPKQVFVVEEKKMFGLKPTELEECFEGG